MQKRGIKLRGSGNHTALATQELNTLPALFAVRSLVSSLPLFIAGIVPPSIVQRKSYPGNPRPIVPERICFDAFQSDEMCSNN